MPPACNIVGRGRCLFFHIYRNVGLFSGFFIPDPFISRVSSFIASHHLSRMKMEMGVPWKSHFSRILFSRNLR